MILFEDQAQPLLLLLRVRRWRLTFSGLLDLWLVKQHEVLHLKLD